MLDPVPYQLQSGWEILAYAVLGLLTGLLAYAFVRLLHWSEELFAGKRPGVLSAWLGRRRLPARAAIGLPPKVAACVPGRRLGAISAVVSIAPPAMPPQTALANVITSGVTP